MKTDNTITGGHGGRLFVTTSLVALLLGMLMLAGRPAFLLTPVLTGHGLAWMEWMILACLLPGLFGVAYSALPRVLGLPLFSEKFVVLHYVFHVAGTLLVILGPLVPGFRQAAMGPTFLACGAVIFAVNAGNTLRGLRVPDIAGASLAVSMLWLLLLALLGTPFAEVAPLKEFVGSGWSAAWLLLAVGGVVMNAAFGLAMRTTPALLGNQPGGNAMAWYSLALGNAGIAWLFAALALSPASSFGLFCGALYIVGLLLAFFRYWGLIQQSPVDVSPWNARIILTVLSMAPLAVAFLMLGIWERMNVPPPDPAAIPVPVEEAASVLPLNFLPVDGAALLTGLLAAAVPALVAIVFQLLHLQHARAGGDSFRTNLGNQILLAAFFNYATGVLMVIPGAWVAIPRIVTLGTLFLLVGAAGFIGNYIYLSRRPRPQEGPEEKGVTPLAAA